MHHRRWKIWSRFKRVLLVLTRHQTRRVILFMNSLQIGGRQKAPLALMKVRKIEIYWGWFGAWNSTAIFCLILGEYFAWVNHLFENRFRSKFKEELDVRQAVMSAWVESQITTSTPVQQNRNHLCAQIKSTWPLGIFLTFFELYGISVFAPSQFFWQLSLSGVRELSRWPLWYTEGGGKFDMKVVPCPKMSYKEVKKSYMEVKKSYIWRWRSLIWRWRPSPWSKPSLLFSTAPIFIFFWPNSGMGSPVSNLTAFIFYQFSTDLWYGDTCFCIEPALVWTKLFTLGMVKTLKSLVSYVLALQVL